MVTVTSANSHGPTVFPLRPCGSEGGETVTLGCLATGFTPSSVTFSWSQDTTSLSNFIQYPSIQKDNSYIGISQIQVSRELWAARRTFQCAVSHAAGQAQASFIMQDVVYKSPTLITGSSLDDDKDEASFSCFAKDFSPKKYAISWRKDGRTLDSKIDEISSLSGDRKDANGTLLYSATSFITIKSSELSDDTVLTCVFEGTWGNSSSVKTENVTFKESSTCVLQGCPTADVEINIIGPKAEDIFLNEKGQLTCQIRVNNGHVKEIWWEDEAGTEMPNKLKGHKLKKSYEHFLDITYNEWHHGVKRYCVVQHSNQVSPQKTLYERRNGETHQRPSVFMLPPVEQTRKDVVTLTCYVKDFFPQDIFVSWLVDDEEADSDYPFRTTNAVENDGSYSAYSQLTLSLDQWKQTDVVYSCVVYHESIGNSTKSIVRSIGYRTLDKTNLVNLNMNVPEKCKA